MRRSPSDARRAARWRWRLWPLLLLPLGSCSFLANEFGWFDRAAPVAQPDGPQ